MQQLNINKGEGARSVRAGGKHTTGGIRENRGAKIHFGAHIRETEAILSFARKRRTSAYLHNGSVPTLYDLLLPPDQRPKTFQVGSREYDPKKVGFVSDGSHGGEFHFDTAKDANHNTGHTYGTGLSEEDRMNLLEYLKSR